ncbi:DNA polymerase III, partial [archaeon]
MRNSEVARILYNISIYLEMGHEDIFKVRAYEKAARSIEGLDKSVEEIYRKGGVEALMDIPGVGVSIAEKIEELLTTGKLKFYENLKKKVPVDIEGLTSIEGIGPKKIKMLYSKLKIKTVEDLEKAARAGNISKLERFGKKSEQDILKNIEFMKKSSGRFLLGFAMPMIEDIERRLKTVEDVEQAVVGGSGRRKKETIGDADILVISKNPAAVMDYFTKMPEVVEIIGKGDTKSSVKLIDGLNVDVRVVPKKSFGAALQYFTGNKDHNIKLRSIAIGKGYKLNEYGVFKGDKQINGVSEESVYETLGLKWMPPELRENTGEIEAAMKNKLPKLIEYG